MAIAVIVGFGTTQPRHKSQPLALLPIEICAGHLAIPA